MRLLALDCSTLMLDVALATQAGPGAPWEVSYEAAHPARLASRLLPETLVQACSAAGVPLKEIDGFVCGLGPGSLTGLRLALASLEGLAYAWRRPLIGIGSHEAMALVGPATGPLRLSTADARRGEVHASLFRVVDGRLETLFGPEALTPAALVARLPEEPVELLGEGVPLLAEALVARGGRDRLLPEARPTARGLLRLAPNPFPPFALAPLFALEPRYVRAPETEWTIKPKQPKPGVQP